MEGRRLKDRCKYLCTLVKLFHFCRKRLLVLFLVGREALVEWCKFCLCLDVLGS